MKRRPEIMNAIGTHFQGEDIVRGIDGYGNMFLYGADSSWQPWLHVSKYPAVDYLLCPRAWHSFSLPGIAQDD